uniref:Uncharacterized protein n=1 Tax=Megaviridae environmental sample TaxID=1737588 RepID=A0A5J6VI97_9VIRU|nr:MAG: hypothetical protein [Megaviridae environmental sample]
MKNTDTSKEISKNLDECIEIGQNIINTFEENSEGFNHNKKTMEEITYLNTMSKIHLQRMHSVWWRLYYYFKPLPIHPKFKTNDQHDIESIKHDIESIKPNNESINNEPDLPSQEQLKHLHTIAGTINKQLTQHNKYLDDALDKTNETIEQMHETSHRARWI